MPKFTDKKGREWDVELDMLACRRIDSSDFTEYYKSEWSILHLDQPTLQALITRTSLTFAVIWALVKPQAVSVDGFIGKSPEEAEIEFISGIGPQAKKEGHDAFLEALGDFFPELKTGLSTSREQLRNLSEKYKDKMGEMAPLLEEIMEHDMDAAVEEIRGRMKQTRGVRLGEMFSSSQL